MVDCDPEHLVSQGVCVGGRLRSFVDGAEHYVRIGEHRGVGSAQGEAAQQNEQTRSTDRRDLVAELSTLREQIAMLDTRGAMLASAVAKTAATSERVAGERTEASTAVGGIPAGSLHADNVRALQAVGVAGNGVGAYGEAEERAIAACLADRPLCQKQNVVLTEESSELQQELGNAQKARALQQQQYESLAGYTGELERTYTQLYNAVPRRRNWWLSVVTLGVAGKPKRLAVPQLEELRRGIGQGKAGN